jgi:hypothetical protein
MQSCAGHVILPPGASLSSVSQFLFFGIPQFRKKLSGAVRRVNSVRHLCECEINLVVMLAVILVLVVGTIRLVGSNANNAFSSVASSLQ